MKKILVLSGIILLAFLLANCAGVSKASEENSAAAKTFEPVSDKGVVFLYRPGKFVASAVQTPIKVNGQDAGGTGPGTFFRWELPPGTYTFLASTQGTSRVVELNVTAGKVYYIEQDEKIGVQDTRVTMKEVDARKAQGVIKRGNLLVSAWKP